jgi:hypothetical protein
VEQEPEAHKPPQQLISAVHRSPFWPQKEAGLMVLPPSPVADPAAHCPATQLSEQQSLLKLHVLPPALQPVPGTHAPALQAPLQHAPENVHAPLSGVQAAGWQAPELQMVVQHWVPLVHAAPTAMQPVGLTSQR